MKRAMLVVTAVLALALAGWAQTSSRSDDQSSNSASSAQTTPNVEKKKGPETGVGDYANQDSTTASTAVGKDMPETGCIVASGGRYDLQKDNGDMVRLIGADVSSHAGQEVRVHGHYTADAKGSKEAKDYRVSGSSNSMETGSSQQTSGSERKYTVAKVDKLSDACKGADKGK